MGHGGLRMTSDTCLFGLELPRARTEWDEHGGEGVLEVVALERLVSAAIL